MGLTTIEHDGVVTVRLRGALTHGTRHELLRTLRAQPAPLSAVCLDARDLREVDTAGLGMLACVARYTRGATGRPPVLLNLADVVHDALASACLLTLFDEADDAASPG